MLVTTCQSIDATKIIVLPSYHLFILFSNGTSGIVNIEHLVSFRGKFSPLKQTDYFQTVTLDSQTGNITWQNGASISSKKLYQHLLTTPREPRCGYFASRRVADG